jgi:hypothetical protein
MAYERRLINNLASLFNIQISKSKCCKNSREEFKFNLTLGNGFLDTLLRWINSIVNKRPFVYKLALLNTCVTNTKIRIIKSFAWN